jgi:DNA-binding SARP family transcriptional activator
MKREQAGGWDVAQREVPVLICLLGEFMLLKAGRPMNMPSGGKTEGLLATMGLRYDRRMARETLLAQLWPNQNPTLAGQSLNSLIYSLRKQLSRELAGAAPILHEDGYYRLNLEAGIGVDLARFEALVQQAEQQAQLGDLERAIACYSRASDLYQGDLWGGSDPYAAVERERLRACYLALLSKLADYWYDHGDYPACLRYGLRLLSSDPCREDAHRIVMRCYLRRGERVQALRQFQLCAAILRAEFDTDPEQATLAFYEQIRTTPDSL